MATSRGLRTYRDEIYPSKELKIVPDNLKMFFKFMYDRHVIWHRRFVEKLPREKWTDNPILKKFKYTNIYRQLDRGTLWAIYVIIKPMTDALRLAHDEKAKKIILKNLLWKLMAYRMCCRIETFEKAGIPDYWNFDPIAYHKELTKVLKHHRPMTNAFLTCPCPSGFTKIDGLVMNMMDARMQLESVYRGLMSGSEKEFFKSMFNIYGMGKFFCYEVYCDICYSGITKFTTNSFVNIGPGCREAIRLIFPSATDRLSEKRLNLLWEKQDKYFKLAGVKDFPYTNWLEPLENKLSKRSIEHSLCEFSKYWLQTKKHGKRRLEYSRWADHPNFTLKSDGINVDMDKAVYDGFYAKSGSYRVLNAIWNDFLKAHVNGKTDYSREDLINFIKKNILAQK